MAKRAVDVVGSIMDEKTKQFVERARKVHGPKFDYSKTNYKTAHDKVCIKCPVHGEFWQTANSHVRGMGCMKCGALARGKIRREKAAAEFSAKASKVHGGKYDYSLVNYLKASQKVSIICPKHGPFLQRPNSHLRGVGCPGCKVETLKTKFSKDSDAFIADARKVHGGKYAYKDDYVNSITPINITCHEHGDFQQRPADHLRGRGCPCCAQEQRIAKATKSHDEFVRQARKAHPDKGFRYLEEYVGGNQKIRIECPKHGEFLQTPNNHMRHGCKVCQAEESSKRQRIGHDEFVKKARAVHGSKYKYPGGYQTAIIPVEIICKKHGSFWQIPNVHLSGCGCPTCSESKGEAEVSKVLKKYKIAYEEQKRFSACRDKYPLPFDFFCPDLDLLIEYDGQHIQTIDHWGGDDALAETMHRDQIKTRWAKDNSLRLLRIPFTQIENIETLILEAVADAF